MGSFYSPSELRTKAEEIVTVAKEETLKALYFYMDAADPELAQEYFATGRIDDRSFRNEPEVPMLNPSGRREFDAWIDNHLAWIPGSFEPFTEPQPEDIDPLVDQAQSLAQIFGAADGALGNSDTSWIRKAQTDMADWEGVLSNNFQNNVLVPLPEIAANHGRIAENLAEAMRATRNLYAAQKRDISEVADQTIAALKGVNKRGADDTAMGLTIVGALAVGVGAMLSLATAGASLAGALALVEAGAAIGAATVAAGSAPLGGKSVPEVLDNMVNRMNDISTKRQEKETKAAKALEKNHELLVALRQLSNSTGRTGPVIPLRPRLLTDPDPTTGLFPEP